MDEWLVVSGWWLAKAERFRAQARASEIATEIPHLTLAQVHAALAYYHANRDEMEAEMEAERLEADRLEREHRESGKKA